MGSGNKLLFDGIAAMEKGLDAVLSEQRSIAHSAIDMDNWDSAQQILALARKNISVVEDWKKKFSDFKISLLKAEFLADDLPDDLSVVSDAVGAQTAQAVIKETAIIKETPPAAEVPEMPQPTPVPQPTPSAPAPAQTPSPTPDDIFAEAAVIPQSDELDLDDIPDLTMSLAAAFAKNDPAEVRYQSASPKISIPEPPTPKPEPRTPKPVNLPNLCERLILKFPYAMSVVNKSSMIGNKFMTDGVLASTEMKKPVKLSNGLWFDNDIPESDIRPFVEALQHHCEVTKRI